MVPINIHVYYFDMVEANKNGGGSDTNLWKKQYDFISEYGVKDMSPSSIMSLFERMSRDGSLVAQYEWN